LLEAGANHNECKCCGTSEHRWVFCRNVLKESSSKKKKKGKKPKVQTLEVTTFFSKVKPRRLADWMTKPAAASCTWVLYEVDSDSMEINIWTEFLMSSFCQWDGSLSYGFFEVQTPPIFIRYRDLLFLNLWVQIFIFILDLHLNFANMVIGSAYSF
jgi:hypothetical protein